ncbi:MAG: hypothetical protein JNK56_32310 [Myxococcales bacterium]|nr:hypothetical protein [Myxococcales bacterium]
MSTAPLAHARRLIAGLLLAAGGVALAAGPPTSAAAAPTSAGPPALEPAPRPRFVGMVAESLRAGPYTYLRVRTAEDERWVVTMDPPPPPLARVAVHSHGLRRDHHSRRLDRRFAALDFAAVRVATDNEETTP